MKKRTKILILCIVTILLLSIIYNISFYYQSSIFNKYGKAYNSERKKIGLHEISKDMKSTKYSWDNLKELALWNYDNSFFDKYLLIFKGTVVPIGIEYESLIESKKPILREKTIQFDSSLFFWKNKITSEIDLYEKYIDSTTYEILVLTYYFEDENGNKDYFEANHYEIKRDQFICGTTDLTNLEKQSKSGKPYSGNITKIECDSILANWNLK